MRELPQTNIPNNKKRNTKNKRKQKPKIFYEMQNNKDYEGTVSYKHTKQQIFNMES